MCKKGRVRCLPWPMVAGHGERERKRALMRKGVEFWIFWKDILGEDILRICWKEKKERKRERNEKREDIFSNLEFENIGNISSRVKVKYAETFQKIPKSSEIQVSRNDS